MESPAPPPAVADDMSWHRYRLVSDQSTDVVYETDLTGTVQWISPSVRSLLGWDPTALVGRTLHDLVHPSDRDRIAALRDSFYREGIEHDAVSCMVATASGGYREMTVRSRALIDAANEITGAVITLTDTHDRDSALRALATLSQANRALVRAADEADLLDRMCRTLIETGRYALAWYGRPVDDEARSVAVAASAGEVDYLGRIAVSWGDGPHGQGPTGRCLRTGETQLQNRFRDDPGYQPWLDAATRAGFGCSVSLAVRVHEAIDGALMVYADEPGAFDTLALELLEDLAADLGYGLERLRGLDDLVRTTAMESEQRQRLQSTLDSMIDPFIIMDAVRDEAGQLIDLRYVDANAAAIEYNTIPREQLIGAQLLDLFPGQLEHGPLRQYFHAIETGEPVILDDYAYGHEVLAEDRRYDIRATKCADGIALTWRDVTDRHVAARQLAESEARYRLLAENAGDVIMLSEDSRTFSWVSDSARTTLGWPPDTLVGRSAMDFIHPDDIPGLVAAITRSDASGETARQKSRWRRPDGRYLWVESAGRPISSEDEELHGRVISVHVIDDQVRAEAELAASEEMFRLLAENSSDVVVLRDEHLRILWASPSTASVLGVEASDAVGRSVADFVDPDDVTAMTAAIEGADPSGAGLHYRIRVRTGSGSYRWFEGRNRPIAAGAGRPAHWVVSLQDIDDQVRAEAELAASEAMFRLLAENSSDVIILAGTDRKALWVSPSVTTMLGWQPDDLVGGSPAQVIHPDDLPAIAHQHDGVIHGVDDARERYRVRCADGSYRWVEAATRPVRMDQGVDARVIIRLRDIDVQVRAEQELGASERAYRLLAENSTDVILITDPRRTIGWASASAEATLGWSADHLIQHSAAEFIHPDDREQLAAAVAESNRTMTVLEMRVRWRRPDGSHHWMRTTGTPFIDDETGALRRIVNLQDIDDQVRAEHDLAAREQQYRLLAENASDLVWQVGPDGIITWASPSVFSILGWDAEEFLGVDSLSFVHPDDQARARIVRTDSAAGHPAAGEFRVLRKDGSARWVSLTVHPVATDAGFARVLSMRDIQDEVAARRELEFALGHDQTTGLPTRQGMLDRIAFVQAQLPEGMVLGVLCVGVDSLREVNEALSHGAGDIVIRTVAARIAQSGASPDLIGRGTGDEFIVVVPDLSSGTDAAQVAERIRQAIHGPIELEGHQVSSTASIGVAIGDHDSAGDDLIRDAALALRQAKEDGRDRYAFVDPSMAAAAERRLALEAAIRDGLAAGEFVPWFQPVVSLTDGSLTGYEALARWQQAEDVSEPGDFIPVAARSSLITEIDLAMLEPVVAALAQLPEPLFVALNVTGQTLARTSYAERVTRALTTHGVRAERLHLEVTETTLLSLNDDVVAQMHALAALGCRWYVDDFGTGYSSISHLRDLPVAGLKLDKSFTDGIGAGEATARQLANALIGLANGLGIDTVAEGVETEAEASYLRTLGWRHGQGWLYGKAAPLP